MAWDYNIRPGETIEQFRARQAAYLKEQEREHAEWLAAREAHRKLRRCNSEEIAKAAAAARAAMRRS